MVLDEKSVEKYYRGLSQEELERLGNFLRDHQLKHIRFNRHSVRYYACGKGEKTVLTFCGGHSGPQVVYDTLLALEEQFRVIVVEFSEFSSLDEFSRGVNAVLKSEGIERVSLIGQSLAGMMAQSYFKRNYGRVDSVVLTNTLAPRKEKNKNWALSIMRLLPLSLFKAIFKKKLKAWAPSGAEMPPGAEERIRFKMAFMRHVVDVYFSKRFLLNTLKMVMEFNEKDACSADDFQGWGGKVLAVTSEDDVGYKDFDTLMKNLPNVQSYTFPAGYGHMAPMVFKDEFYRLIRGFLRDAPQGGRLR